MNCPTCHQSVKPRVTTEDQSKNGVRVIVHRYPDGSTVDAGCGCFGSDFRAHSRVDCPNRLRQIAERA